MLDKNDIFKVIEGNYCPLRIALSKTGLPSEIQYYPLRYKYCRAKFKETHGKDAENVPFVVPSIEEFWRTCEKNLERLEKEMELKFDIVALKTGNEDLEVDAIGSMAGHDHCIFKLIFAGSWRKVNAVKMIKEYDHLEDKFKTDGTSLVALILGKDEDKVQKLYRVIPKDDVFNKKGSIVELGWDALRIVYNDGVEQSRELERLMQLETKKIPTNPNPANCGSCPYHNVMIDDDGVMRTCTGFYHDL